jgi:hypothetical protein
LTTLFGTVESDELPLIRAAARKKNGWLPFLTVLFMISYGLMTMVIVEQGRTVDSQRALIQELLKDSKELSSMKANAQRQQAAKPQQITPQNPSTQAPAKKAPSSQAGSQFNAHDDAAQQKPFRKLPKTVSDVGDNSRALFTI